MACLRRPRSGARDRFGGARPVDRHRVLPAGRADDRRRAQRLDAGRRGRALLAGPSPEEQGRLIVSELPGGLALLGLEVEGGVATVDLGRAFADGDSASVSARSAQVVLTLTGFSGVQEVRLLVEGAEYAALTRADVLAPPPAPRPSAAPALPRIAGSMTVLQLQRRLVKLGYLPQAAATDHFDQRTLSAVIAFQKWEGLVRDGVPGPATQAALLVATRPKPRTKGPGTAWRSSSTGRLRSSSAGGGCYGRSTSRPGSRAT